VARLAEALRDGLLDDTSDTAEHARRRACVAQAAERLLGPRHGAVA
jgi:hypothetical protein